jgi:uncharacterized protein YkwD
MIKKNKEKKTKERSCSVPGMETARLQVVICVHVSLAQASAEDFVKAHNEIRVLVGDVPISWNETLAAGACLGKGTCYTKDLLLQFNRRHVH